MRFLCITQNYELGKQHYRNRGFKSGGERIVASAKIFSRRIPRILQAEAPGALAFFDHQQVHFSAFHFG